MFLVAFALSFLTVPPQNTLMVSHRNTSHSLPKKQRKNKTCTVVIKYPYKKLTQGNAAERIILVLHQNQNQAAQAVKFYPVLRDTKAFRDVCLNKRHTTPIQLISVQSRGSFTE